MGKEFCELWKCDRCGYTEFFRVSTDEIPHGIGTTTVIKKRPKDPDGWKSHAEIGVFCSRCEMLFMRMLHAFMDETCDDKTVHAFIDELDALNEKEG